MSDVVLDASFIVKLFIEEPGSATCVALFRARRNVGAAFYMPAHAPAEVLEIACRKLTRDEIAAEQLDDIVRSLPCLGKVEPLDALLDPALRIAIDFGVSVYDALYVALAEARTALLLTCDLKLVRRLNRSPLWGISLGVTSGGPDDLAFEGYPLRR